MRIRDYLEKNGPCLSSKVKNILINETGMSDEAARQQISRARGEVCHLTGMQFPKRETFLYLKTQFKTLEFYNNLIRAFIDSSSVHKCIMTGFDNFAGRVSIEKLKILSGSPKANTKKKTFDQLIHELMLIDLINTDENYYYLNDLVSMSDDATFGDSRTLEYINDFIREILALWLKNNSVVSYDAIQISGDFCSYFWDIKAPSYLLPLVEIKEKVKPGFVVADILPKYDISLNDIDYFIRKIESCNANKRNRPFIPILLGYRFDAETLRYLRSKNILVSTISNFFGEEVEKILNNIAEILKSSVLDNTNNISNISDILDKIIKIEGETNNLRGHFFELIVGHIASQIHTGQLTLNRKINNNGKRAEIDILVITSNELIIYECKGYKSGRLVTKTEIDEWKNKISNIYQYFKNNDENSNKQIIFNYLVASNFMSDANDYITKLSNETHKYTIKKMNGHEILTFAKHKNLSSVCEILKHYFINETKEKP